MYELERVSYTTNREFLKKIGLASQLSRERLRTDGDASRLPRDMAEAELASRKWIRYDDDR